MRPTGRACELNVSLIICFKKLVKLALVSSFRRFVQPKKCCKNLETKPRSVFDKRFFLLPKLIFDNLRSGDFFFGKGEGKREKGERIQRREGISQVKFSIAQIALKRNIADMRTGSRQTQAMSGSLLPRFPVKLSTKMEALGTTTRRWNKFREVLWLSCKWKTREIQPACRRFSTERKELARIFPWTLFGSLAVGVSIGYQIPKLLNKSKGHLCSLKVEAKTSDGNNSSNSGSPPRSATFNFIADAVEKAAPAVVYIEITGRRTGFGFLGHVGPTSSGSGFIVSEDGMVLTNAHVVENAVHVNVKLRDGRSFSGSVVDIDLENDLAAVKLVSHKVSLGIKFN